MYKTALLGALLIIALLGPCRSQAIAGDIALSLTTAASFTHEKGGSASADRAGVKATITNNGNESAQKVSIEARLLDDRQTVSLPGQLMPGKPVDAAFKMPLPGALSGSYPVYLNVRYEHTNGTAASAAFLALLRTTAAPRPPAFSLNIEQTGDARITVHVSAKEPAITEVRLTCHIPGDLTVEQERQLLRLENGKGSATFKVASAKGVQGRYAVHVVGEAELNGRHETVSASVVVPITPKKSFLERMNRQSWQRVGYGAYLLTLLLGIFTVLYRGRKELSETVPQPQGRETWLVDTVILAAILLFILINLNPRFLVTQTTATGGDMASHYYSLDYLRHVLLPQGKISGWTMGNYAGFPLLQFYFPLPFLLMCLLNVAIPLQVAFKIVSLLGTLLLPFGAYLMLRGLRRPFPAPILGAIFTLPFLFHSANSMWGGNILSTLAGEFSYSLSFSLSLILLGTLYYGARNDRWVIGNALLVFMVGFSHGYTLLFVEAVSLFFLITHDGFLRRLIYLFKVYALGFLLMAFWLVPLLIFTRFTTSFHLVWALSSWREILPPQFLFFAILSGVGSLLIAGWCLFRRPDNELLTATAYLWFGVVVSIVFFIVAPKLGVVDIRYLPYGQLLICLLAAPFLGWLASFLPKKGPLWTLPLFCMLGVFLWVGGNLGPAPGWSKWNYEGFEAKQSWPLFKEINNQLKGGVSDPRVVYEHAEEHNVFGSIRAFESLPYFAGRATLEGLYMQASISAPFVFYIQSEVSAVKSAPFPQYTYANMNFKRALPHLRLFNVGELVIRSDGAKKAIRAVEGYRFKKRVGEYELWDVTANSGHYVEPLAFEPVLFPAAQWKTDSYRWFMNEKQLAVHLVFDKESSNSGGDGHFKASSNDISSLPNIPIDTTNCQVRETVGNDEIKIETNWIGKPLLVKVSYHPNWQVEGADRIYLVSPSFMLIYPTQTTVRLHYGWGWPDWAGTILTILGLVILALNLPVIGRERTTAWNLAAARLNIPPSLVPELRIILAVRLRKRILITVLLAVSLGVSWLCYHIYASDMNRIFNRGVRLRDAKRFDEARADFRKVLADQPASKLSHDSAYHLAICYYLENKNVEAIAAFRKMIADYPKSQLAPEALYHIGLCQFRLGEKTEGVATMKRVIQEYPGADWAKYANDRLAENK
ncbi:MAG: 6-pyruvoyl-tetrahydropterin synthase-related protein [Desulfuromonadaceae bacterium]|nr:6-pyruvoyl-tetrahydropterin synthase-related protein [Desulfuromonadaceae bacterium]